MSDRAERLRELHPLHARARDELLDLVQTMEIPDEPPRGGTTGAVRASAGPFLRTDAPSPDVAPESAGPRHILLRGPAGVGKRHLAWALRRILGDDLVQVVSREGARPGSLHPGGLAIWIARDGKTPAGCPPEAPEVRVRGLSRRERETLLREEILPLRCRLHGIDPAPFLQPEVFAMILDGGELEAGLHGAEERLARLCRRRSRELAEGGAPPDSAWATSVLGEQALAAGRLPERLPPGVAVAPMVSSWGGALARLEAWAEPGKGRLVVTGLGPEAQAACQVARTRLSALAHHLQQPPDDLRNLDWHLHVGGGTGARDGASLGLAALVAMASHLSGVRVEARRVFTGELSLSGTVQPVGGIEEKYLACERAGSERLHLPRENLVGLATLGGDILAACGAEPVDRDEALLCALGLARRSA